MGAPVSDQTAPAILAEVRPAVVPRRELVIRRDMLRRSLGVRFHGRAIPAVASDTRARRRERGVARALSGQLR